jgi:hypothetical protein
MGTILNSAMTGENNYNNALPSYRHYPALPAPSASHSQIMSRTSTLVTDSIDTELFSLHGYKSILSSI